MREISHESSCARVLAGDLAPELSRENLHVKSRASSCAKPFNNGNTFMKRYVGRYVGK